MTCYYRLRFYIDEYFQTFNKIYNWKCVSINADTLGHTPHKYATTSTYLSTWIIGLDSAETEARNEVTWRFHDVPYLFKIGLLKLKLVWCQCWVCWTEKLWKMPFFCFFQSGCWGGSFISESVRGKEGREMEGFAWEEGKVEGRDYLPECNTLHYLPLPKCNHPLHLHEPKMIKKAFVCSWLLLLFLKLWTAK